MRGVVDRLVDGARRILEEAVVDGQVPVRHLQARHVDAGAAAQDVVAEGSDRLTDRVPDATSVDDRAVDNDAVVTTIVAVEAW